MPAFTDIRGDVARLWQDEAHRAQNQKALEDLIKKYKVVVEDDTE